MKKKLKIILLLLLFLFISGCNNNKEYKVIDISAEDLLLNLQQGKTMIVFGYSDDSKKSETMRNDVQNIAKDIMSDIYHIDFYHVDMEFGNVLNYSYGITIDDNYYYVFNGLELLVAEYYSNLV